LARRGGRPCFEADEIAAGETFASALAVVLDLAGTRVSLEEVKLAAEHERIARDLHDTVIQRLFAIGMGLQATEREAGPAVGGRIRSTVDAIDEVIREIRETIFDLSHPSDDSSGQRLRSQVRKVLRDATDQLGFAPRLEFRGPVESSVPDELISDVAAVVREALSNVARHARATAADVIVAGDDTTLTIMVSDDGLGMSDSPSAGHGIANLSSRASDLGGDLKISARKPSGTVVVWKVPLP
jgi:signal transduction histidine kinase